MARGYDEAYGYYLGGEDYWDHTRNGGLDWHRNDTLETGENGTYSAELIGNAAVEFVSRAPSPWFLYLPFQSVHSPLEAPQRYLDMYPHLSGSQRMRAAMVTAMDDQVGDLVAALKKRGQLESTGTCLWAITMYLHYVRGMYVCVRVYVYTHTHLLTNIMYAIILRPLFTLTPNFPPRLFLHIF